MKEAKAQANTGDSWAGMGKGITLLIAASAAAGV